MLLDSVIREFARAEITTIWIHHRIHDTYHNLFSIIELCPMEQQFSPAIESIRKNGKRVPFVYIKLDQHRTLYIGRKFRSTPEEGLAYFRNPKILHRTKILPFDHSTSSIEKMDPILTKDTRNPRTPLEHILPRRSVAFRVWAGLDENQVILKQLNEHDIVKLDILTKQYLGFNLSMYKEFIGAMLLALPNPYLRMLKVVGIPKEASIIFLFYERLGKTIVDGKIEISEVRYSEQGFQIKRKITHNKMHIKLPYIVKEFHAKIFDLNNQLIYEDTIPFL